MAADVGGGDSGKKKGKKRGKKANPRIDMTPLVDLGFLLLTFFVLTTTLSTPFTMPVVVPAKEEKEDKPEDKDKISEKKVLNLLLTGNNRVFYYQGIGENVEMNMTNFNPNQGVRQLLAKKKVEVKKFFPNDEDPLVVLIKMSDDATYKNWVDIIDEMNIGSQKRYMLMDIMKEELEFVKDYETNEGLQSSIVESLAALEGGETSGSEN